MDAYASYSVVPTACCWTRRCPRQRSTCRSRLQRRYDSHVHRRGV